MTVRINEAPADLSSRLSELTDGREASEDPAGEVQCVLTFVRSQAEVQRLAPAALRAVAADGLLWFAYPKKSGMLKSDLSRDSGWEPVFENGFDSVAQISIDETWTGFRFRRTHLVGKRTRS